MKRKVIKYEYGESVQESMECTKNSEIRNLIPY